MGLVDLLRRGKKKQEKPIDRSTLLESYEKKDFIDGSNEETHYKNMEFFEEVARLKKRYEPMYKRARELNGKEYNKIPNGFLSYDAVDRLVDELYGQEVMIRKKGGFYYGKLDGFDGKHIYLDKYVFDKNMLKESDYHFKIPCHGGDTIMLYPDNILSMQKMPWRIEDPVEDLDDVIEAMAADRLYGNHRGKSDITMKDYFKGDVPLLFANYCMPHPHYCETGEPYSDAKYDEVSSLSALDYATE